MISYHHKRLFYRTINWNAMHSYTLLKLVSCRTLGLPVTAAPNVCNVYHVHFLYLVFIPFDPSVHLQCNYDKKALSIWTFSNILNSSVKCLNIQMLTGHPTTRRGAVWWVWGDYSSMFTVIWRLSWSVASRAHFVLHPNRTPYSRVPRWPLVCPRVPAGNHWSVH